LDFSNTIKITDNCASENKSKHIISFLRNESSRILIYKSSYHGKSAIDGMHNFPCQVAEKQNKENNALNIPDLIEACEEKEFELYEQLKIKTKER
jgi:hypothetical protein